MAGVPPVTSSTKETTNYARLCRLLVDVGSQALRDTFNSIHAPGSLHTVLANPPAQTILQSLYKPKKGKKKILNPNQWGKLYPAIPTSVSSAHFDITLLMILLRNICSLSPPATGWDALPPAADTSVEADIVRVKYFRNVVYGHAEQASVDDTSFNNHWHDIKAALVRLGGTSYGDAIDDLQNACMDPGVEEYYKELLQQWKRDEDSIQDQLNEIEGDVKYVRKKLNDLTEMVSPKKEVIVEEISNYELDIPDLASRYDPATRQWLLEDFDKWFSDPGDSKAYVLLGDPAVGKSVMAGVLAQRSRDAGHLGAAYFCCYNDNTRNDPRYLLGTIASQLCECNSEYNSIMGGEGGIRQLLGNCNYGVQELFTKLLKESLGKCNSTLCHQRKLVVIDALDETQYESREDFLDLIMNSFPLLSNWLVFFITSRPENTVQFTFKKYNPCVRICAGNVERDNFYQQHLQDIKLFLRNSVDFSRLPFSVDDLVKRCSGSFLYASYIAKDLNAELQSGKSFQVDDLFPGGFDNFLRKNFKRVFDKVGSSLFKKLFGCAIAAPAPLPVSFISYVLQREKSSISKQRVLDALSLFMVLSKTFAFRHNLFPAWLTEEDKARELFIDRNSEATYVKDVILEILSGFIREQSQDVPRIKVDLLDYVLRVGIRFLSGFPGKKINSLETVFNCLTSFKYIEKRIQSRRIEIYSLIEDYKRAADCQGEGRKEILLEVCSALERNIYVLLGCPHLLHSCLQNTSKVIQDNVVIPDSVSTTWLQLNQSMPLPCKRLRHMSNFAVSPDGKLFAERHWKHIFLLDSYSHQCVGVFSSIELERYLVPGCKCLEFSPDGTFLFFGRLDRWFSLENKTVETFPQFSKIDSSYEWGSFTLNKQCIVVKRCNFSFKSNNSCCWLCLLNYLCLWAAEEIGHETEESETICGCFPHRLQVQIRPSAGTEDGSPVPAMRILLNILRKTHHDKWCSLLQKLQLINYPFEATCWHCLSRITGKTITLAGVRDFIISHYNDIFKYQVWDLQTGRSALEQAFSSGIQLTPFTYLCHLGTALEKCGLLFSGIDKSLSLCNIALLNTVCYHLFFVDCSRRSFIWKLLEPLQRSTQLEKPRQRGQLEDFQEFVSSRYLKEYRAICEPDELHEEEKFLGRETLFELDKLLLKRENLHEDYQLKLDKFLEQLEESEKFEEVLSSRHMTEYRPVFKLDKLRERKKLLDRKRLLELDKLLERKKLLEDYKLKLKEFLERIKEAEKFQKFPSSRYSKTYSAICELDNLLEEDKLLKRKTRLREYYQLKLDEFIEQVAQREGEGLELFGAGKLLLTPSEHLHHSWPKRFSKFKQLEHLCWFQEAFHFGTKTFINAPLELQYLPDVKDKGLFTSILPCVSPDGKWIAIRLESEGTTVQLYHGQHQRQHHPYWRNSVHVIKDVEYFTFTNDSVFFLYLTLQRSLHTLSLASGTTLTSVSGVRPLFFAPERQAGYRFQVDDEENIILVKDFPTFFLSKFFPFVRADLMQVSFASADAVLVLYSDSTLALMKNDGTAFAWETSLTHSFSGRVKKAQFSPDGKLIVTHQGANISLYRTMPASAGASIDHVKCPDSVFEANDDFTVLHFTISADSTLLLFCIRRNIGLSFFVWNVPKKVLSASFDSPGLTSEDCCCCFSSNNTDLIICSEFCIEFWDHSSNPCRLLRRVETDVPYTEIDKFTHCTVSPGNGLLACCITDKIFLFPLKTSTDQCALHLPRAHLGKVEFCQFLKGNRYLISYGVDGNVFLWDFSEWKVVAFVKIAQGRESIISMAVSNEEDKLVCATSFGRLKIIKLCGLKGKVLSKLPLSKGMGSEKMTEACGVQVEKPTAAIQSLACSDSNEDLDVAELIEEMDFMLRSDDSEDSDEEDELLD